MKKIISIVMVVIFLTGCSPEKMPIPPYPLEESTVKEALSIWKPDYTVIQNFENPHNLQGSTWFSLSDPSDLTSTYGIHSATSGEERALYLTFASFYNKEAVHDTEMEKGIVFATQLFGGFNNEKAVYQEFVKEFPHTNTTIKEVIGSISQEDKYKLKSKSTWEKEVQGITVRIQVEQPYLEDVPEYILAISMRTDTNSFPP